MQILNAVIDAVAPYVERFILWNWAHPDISFAAHYCAILCGFVVLMCSWNVYQRIRDIWGR